MKKPKLFVVKGHSGWMVEKDLRTTWCDVWLETSAGKNKKKNFCVTLIALPEARSDHSLNVSILNDRTVTEGMFTPDRKVRPMTPEEEAEHVEHWAKEVERTQDLLNKLEANQLVLDEDNVYISEEHIDRDIAFDAIKSWLEFTQGYGNVKLKVRKPKIVVCEVTLKP